jgi:thioredoxin-related protein
MTNGTPPVAEKYGVVALPAILFFDSKGNELKDVHLINKEVGPVRFLETLKKVT